MPRSSSSPASQVARWLSSMARGGDPVGRRERRRAVHFESLETRAVPAALPVAVAPPATATQRDGVAPVALVAAPVAVRAAAVAAPAPPTLGLAAESNSGSKTDTRTNVVAPFVTGRAAPGSVVTLTVTGVAGFPADVARGVTPVRVPATGIWRVKLPPLAAGPHVVTARVSVAGKQSAAATTSFVVDTTRPTAQMTFAPNTDTVTVRVSKPVAGLTLQSFRISGTTADGLQFTNLPLTDSRIAQTVGVGSVALARSPDGLTYVLRSQYALATPGTYMLRLMPTGIVDAVGNPLAAEVRLTTKIV
jgi:hypothetical protein